MTGTCGSSSFASSRGVTVTRANGCVGYKGPATNVGAAAAVVREPRVLQRAKSWRDSAFGTASRVDGDWPNGKGMNVAIRRGGRKGHA